MRNTAASEGGLTWLTGYVPADNVDAFKAAAAENRWAWVMDDPADDDELVPTKVRYNKVTRLMVPIFDILGVVPGYREYDISFWFLAFFSLFFAMILGDAGYGVLLLIGAVILTVKSHKLSDATMLLWVLSIATIVWGALTGTWFGLEAAMKVPILRALTVPILANYPDYFGVSATVQQNAIMKFCFILGTVQLSLACVMSIKRKLTERNLSWIADLGWLIAICAIYFLALYLVIGAVEVEALLKSCLPPTLLRSFLFVTASAGFFGAVLLFHTVLSLPPLLPGTALPVLLVSAAAILAERLCAFILCHVPRRDRAAEHLGPPILKA